MLFDNETLKKREELIENARNVLKEEFIGIDNEIDGLLNNIKPWFLFPELQQSPCVINIFGLTGTGKTSIVKRIVQLLDIEQDLVYFNFAAINEMQGWEVEETIEEQLSNECSKRVFVYDEFQYAATLDGDGMEKDNKSCLKPFWELLDTGVIHKRNSYWTTREVQKVCYYLEKILSVKNIVIENGIWTNADECLEDFTPYDIRKFHEIFNFKLKNDDTEDDEEKGKSYTLNTPIMRLGSNFENDFFINENYFTRIMELYDKVNEQNSDHLDVYHRFCKMSFDEIYNVLYDVLTKARKGYDLNFKQSIIFVIANLDEAYEMSFNTDPDMSADQFHKATKKISILDIKNALKKRFRNEQIARLGNIHMIYPSFNRESFKKIIDLYLNKYRYDVKELTNIDIEYKQSLKDFLYKESVFPTQGTRPIFSSIHEIVKTKLPNIFQFIRDNNLECTKFVLSYKNKNTIATIYNGEEKVGKTKFKEVIRLQNLRESTKDDKQALVAVHESAHFIIYSLLNGKTPIKVCTKTVNKDNNGFVETDVNENDSVQSLINDIKVAVAGYVAERMVFGDDMLTCGASSDLKKATMIAASMVRNFGMGDYVSVRTYQTGGPTNPSGLLTFDDKKSTQDINEFVERAISKCMDDVEKLLKDKNVKPAFCKAITYLSENSNMSPKKMTEIYDSIDKNVRDNCKIVTNYKEVAQRFCEY